MAVTEMPVTDGVRPERTERGFRPSSRRRSRIAGGLALAAAAIGGNVMVYASLDDGVEVLQVVRDVPAGQRLTSDDLRVVEVDVDPTVRTLAAHELGIVVGQYAKVRLVSGSLVVVEALQPDPLVSAGSAVVAVQVREGALPVGLRERSQVQLVIPDDAPDAAAPVVVVGRTVGLPTAPETITGTVSLSVEVARDDAATVVASDDVRVVLLDPGDDAAAAPTATTEAGS